MFFVFFRCDNISSTNLLKSVHPYIFQGKDEALLRENKRIVGWKTFIYWKNPWPFTGSKETKAPPSTHPHSQKVNGKGMGGVIVENKVDGRGVLNTSHQNRCKSAIGQMLKSPKITLLSNYFTQNKCQDGGVCCKSAWEKSQQLKDLLESHWTQLKGGLNTGSRLNIESFFERLVKSPQNLQLGWALEVEYWNCKCPEQLGGRSWGYCNIWGQTVAGVSQNIEPILELSRNFGLKNILQYCNIFYMLYI